MSIAFMEQVRQQFVSQPLSMADRAEEEIEARRRRLREAFAYKLASESAISRKAAAKQAVEEVIDPIERKWLIEEVAEVAKKKEWARRKREAETGYAGRFTTAIQKPGQAAGEAAARMFIETPVRLIKGVVGVERKPEDVRFLRSLESAKLGEAPFIPEDAPFTQKVAVGGAGMAPGILASAATFGVGGTIGVGAFWAASEFPESRDDFLEAGLSPPIAALAGGAVAGAIGATEAALPVPGTTKGPAGALIRRGTEAAAQKVKELAAKRGIKAVSPRISMAAKEIVKAVGGYVTEVGTEGIQEAEKEAGLQIAARVSEDVEARPVGDIPQAFKRGVKGAAPGMLLFAGGGGGLGIAAGAKQIQFQENRETIKELAIKKKAITRTQWNKLKLPKRKGEVPPQRVRKEVIQELGRQFEEEDAQRAREEAIPGPEAAIEAPIEPEVSEVAVQPGVAPETPGASVLEAETPAAEQGDISLTKTRSAEIRKTLGLEALSPEKVESWDTVAAEVRAEGLTEKAVSIARNAVRFRVQLSTRESMALVEKVKDSLDELRDARIELTQAKEAGSVAEHTRVTGVIQDIMDDIDLLTRGSTFGRRENARALSVGQYVANREKYDLGNLVKKLQNAKGPKRTPTAEELSLLEKGSAKLEKYVSEEQQIKEEERIKEEKDEMALAEKVIKARRPRRKVGAAVREKAKIEREEIKKRIRALGEAGRVHDITALSVESLYLMGRLGVAYIKEGTGTLIEVAERLRSDLPDLNITELDTAKALITRNPKEIARVRSEATKRVARLKTISAIKVRMDGLARGIDLAVKREKAPVPEDIKKLRKELTKAVGEFYESEIDAAKLENAIELANRLTDDLEAGTIRMKEKREKKAISPELKDVQGRIREIWAEVRIDAELAKIKEQVRTGKYDESVKKEKKPISRRLERKQIEIMKARRELKKIISNAQPWTAPKVLKEVSYSLKAVAATADLSFTMRQNLWQVFAHPVHGAKAFGPSIKAFFSEYSADQINNAILNSENAFWYDVSKLAIQDAGSMDAQAVSEVYRGKVIENVKLFGKQNPFGWLMSASSRHAVAFSNLMRTSAFDHFMANNPNATRDEMKMMAWYINVSTGVGDLSRAGAIGDILQHAFFSPKFAVSRFQTPYSLWAAHRKRLPRVRKQIAKDLTRTVATGALVLKLAALAGAELVGWDPEDPDWGKIRWGNVHIDIWGGFQQPSRVIARLAKIVVADAEGGDPSPWGIIGRFSAFKFSPALTLPYEIVVGETAVGKEITPPEALLGAAQPLVLRDIREAWAQEGAGKAIVVAGLVGLGVGVSVYADSPTSLRKKIKKAEVAGEWGKAQQLRRLLDVAKKKK